MAPIILLIVAVLVLLYWPTRPEQMGKVDNHAVDTSHGVQPEHLRVKGETIALTLGLLGLVMVLALLLRITFGAILILVLFSVVSLKIRQGQLAGHSVRVSDKQLPQVYAAAQRAAARLNLPLPDLFVTQDPVINAYALGFFGRKSIVLNSGTVEALNPDELCYVIGHELTHIKCAHTHWLVFTTLNDTFQLPIFSTFLGLLLRGWSRKAEYTSDRGGLVANQDIRSAISAMGKMVAGKTLAQDLNFDALLDQRVAMNDDNIARIAETFSDHPYVVNRVVALVGFSTTDRYRSLTGSSSI